MKIVIKFSNQAAKKVAEIFYEAARNIPDNPSEDYWAQDVFSGAGHVEITTWSGKGKWTMKTNNRDSTILEFNGYRNSFADGTCEFNTCDLPWEGAEILETETSDPSRLIQVHFPGEYVNLPEKGIVSHLAA